MTIVRVRKRGRDAHGGDIWDIPDVTADVYRKLSRIPKTAAMGRPLNRLVRHGRDKDGLWLHGTVMGDDYNRRWRRRRRRSIDSRLIRHGRNESCGSNVLDRASRR